MKRAMKNELLRSFRSKSFCLSLCASSLLILWYSIERIPFCIKENLSFSTEKYAANFLQISYTNWIGSHNLYIQQNLFYLLLPFFAALPFATSFFSDIDCGFGKNLLLREKKCHYLISKYFSVFISGGVAVVLPMAVSFLISCCFLPTMSPQSSFPLTNIFSGFKWSELLFINAPAYVILYLLVVFLFSGLLACCALPISYFTSKSFLPLIFPFFLYMCISMLCNLLDLQAYSLSNILVTTDYYSTTFSTCIMLLILSVISFVPFFLIGMKKDSL